MFTKGQIVKGKVYGVFVVLGHKDICGERYNVLKAVHPDDHTVRFRGQLCLPDDALEAV